MPFISRTITFPSRNRTTIRLSKAFWDAINEIAQREGAPVSAVVQRARRAEPDGTAEAVRVFALNYYRRLVRTLEQGRGA